MSDKVAWCEIENAEYTADLDQWAGLCSPEPLTGSLAPTFGAKTVLELGAGVGRVSVRLRALGAEVWALDNERELLDEIVRLAAAGGIGMTFHPDLEQAWADDGTLRSRLSQVRELDGRTFETEPLESYWCSRNGERSLRIVWSRRVDGEESTTERSYADLTEAMVEGEALGAELELGGFISGSPARYSGFCAQPHKAYGQSSVQSALDLLSLPGDGALDAGARAS